MEVARVTWVFHTASYMNQSPGILVLAREGNHFEVVGLEEVYVVVEMYMRKQQLTNASAVETVDAPFL